MNSLNSTISSHQKGQHLALTWPGYHSNHARTGPVPASNCPCPQLFAHNSQVRAWTRPDFFVSRQTAPLRCARDQIRRLNCGRKQAFLAKTRFIKYVETHFFKQGWSLDACAGRALASGAFTRNETVCTKTLYHYVERGLLQIKATDLPECLSRKTKAKRVRRHKRQRDGGL